MYYAVLVVCDMGVRCCVGGLIYGCAVLCWWFDVWVCYVVLVVCYMLRCLAFSNEALFRALFLQALLVGRSGCARTALELSKLILSLTPGFLPPSLSPSLARSLPPLSLASFRLRA